MSYLVNSFAADASINSIKATVQNLTIGLEPHKVNLTDSQKVGLRSMAEGREGYARLISQIASNNINSLPREHNPDDLVTRLAYDSTLEGARQALMSLLETVSETQLANSIDIMKFVDDYAASLQISRNNNAALDLAMREVDDWNSRFANKTNNNTPPATGNS
jgi:hypothetical protein